jgi:hypothetical protein
MSSDRDRDGERARDGRTRVSLEDRDREEGGSDRDSPEWRDDREAYHPDAWDQTPHGPYRPQGSQEEKPGRGRSSGEERGGVSERQKGRTSPPGLEETGGNAIGTSLGESRSSRPSTTG